MKFFSSIPKNSMARILVLSLSMVLFTAKTSYSMFNFFNSEKTPTGWIKDETNKEYEKLLDAENYGTLIKNLTLHIYTEQSSEALEWVQKATKTGCVPLQCFFISYAGHLTQKGYFDSTEVEGLLAMVVMSLMRAYQDLSWVPVLGDIRLSKGANETINIMKKSYESLLKNYIKTYNFSFDDALNSAQKMVEKFNLDDKNKLMSPLWLCCTPVISGNVLIFSDCDKDLIKIMKKTSKFSEINIMRNNAKEEILKIFVEKYTSWEKLFKAIDSKIE